VRLAAGPARRRLRAASALAAMPCRRNRACLTIAPSWPVAVDGSGRSPGQGFVPQPWPTGHRDACLVCAPECFAESRDTVALRCPLVCRTLPMQIRGNPSRPPNCTE